MSSEFISILDESINSSRSNILENSKMWFTIFAPLKLKKILRNLSIFQFVQLFGVAVNVNDTKKADHIVKISTDIQSSF